MPFWHFEILTEYAHENELTRAQYTAMAFHKPEELWQGKKREVSPEQEERNIKAMQMLVKGGRAK